MFELNDLSLLEQIVSTSGISGDEYKIRDLVESVVKNNATWTCKDTFGNLVVFKEGTAKKNKKKIIFDAHTDEIGLIVKHIEKGGFIRFLPVGGIDPKTIIAQEFVINGRERQIRGVVGVKAIHIQKEEERKAATKLDDCFIDTGLSEEEVRKNVSVGDTISRISPVRRLGDTICTKSLDNRVCVYTNVAAFMQIKECHHDIYLSFSAQEEVGLRGARITANCVSPDISINVDIGMANDIVGSPEHEYETKLGCGPAIKFMDSSVISNRHLVFFMKKLAEKESIPHQFEVANRGGTNTAAMQYITGKKSMAAAISVPCRYAHSPVEMCHVKDIENTCIFIHKLMQSDFEELLPHFCD